MNQHTFKILEYDKIKEMLKEHAACSLGLERIERLMPYTNPGAVRRHLRETKEAVDLIESEGRIPLGGITDIRELVRFAAIQSLLQPHQLNQIMETLAAARRLKSFLTRCMNKAPSLYDYSTRIGSFEKIEERISFCINDKSEVKDSASDELFRVRTSIRTLHGRMMSSLNATIRSCKTLIQEPIVTIRGDRYCIPVKAECKNQFGGLVHDQSASGATLFMEPMAVVELGNEIRQLQAKELQEIEKILSQLTAMVGEMEGDILLTIENLAAMDFISSKGLFALRFDAIEPLVNDAGILDVIEARHPLLTGNVVPIDYNLGGKFRTLVITGPNTGGKTVTLKTIGLLTLMMQSGLHVPVREGSKMAVFEQVFSDIGDEQSIQQSLSTFSSHIKQIIQIVENVDDKSLVLLDEVGAGTDPSEGAALARAILTYLNNKSARTVATTHYGELKEFAYSTEGVENASVEFNMATLKPTYRLMIGVPGHSNALSIAKRLGLPDYIITSAQEQMNRSELELGEIIRQLEESRKVAEDDRKLVDRTSKELVQLKKKYDQELSSLKNERRNILAEAKVEANELIKKAKMDVNRVLAEIRRQTREGRETETFRKEVLDITDSLVQDFDEVVKNAAKSTDLERIELLEAIPTLKEAPPQVGDTVLITTLNQQGILMSEVSNGGTVQVQIGAMKLNVPVKSVKLIEEPEKPKAVQERTNISDIQYSKRMEVPTELHLRMLRVEEALFELDKYIDDAYLAGMPSVRIVHGKGTGAMKNAVWEFLKDSPHIKKYYHPEYNEGGTGVTVVEFK